MAPPPTIIHIQPLAPPKPAPGAVCNGCGICCLAEPCPVGILLSGRRTGACDALRWDEGLRQYRCGAIQVPAQVLQTCLPWGLRWAGPALAPWLRRLARRWIALGVGCDSTLEPLPGDSTTMASTTATPSSHCGANDPYHD